jgi:NADPH:quinone reductase-like Zn-dependent oxidoreductase
MNMPIWSIPLGPFTAEKTICSDFAGTVVAAGENSSFGEGDEVFGVTLKPFAPCGGTMSEMSLINLDNACVIKKPKEMTFVQAAGLGCVFLTARTCIEHVQAYVEPTSSKRVVVLGGSSSAGMYTVYLAKQRGWKVLATCSGKNKDWVQNTMGQSERVRLQYMSTLI